MINIEKLLDKCESMTLLCTRTATYWSYIKMAFNIPLVFTNSSLCIINSISTDANTVKIPNIVVNAISVLIISLSNNIKASEKFEIFKKLSQQFMLLSQEIESLDAGDTNINEKIKLINVKYENLIQDCAFEDIPQKHKTNVAKIFGDANRFLPIQLNGIIGNNLPKRNISIKEISSMNINESNSKKMNDITLKSSIDLESNLEV
jgi:hypothetical protein